SIFVCEYHTYRSRDPVLNHPLIGGLRECASTILYGLGTPECVHIRSEERCVGGEMIPLYLRFYAVFRYKMDIDYEEKTRTTSHHLIKALHRVTKKKVSIFVCEYYTYRSRDPVLNHPLIGGLRECASTILYGLGTPECVHI